MEYAVKQEPIILFSPNLKGTISLPDLLNSEGTIQFVIKPKSMSNEVQFQVIAEGFVFILSFDNGSFIFQRNGQTLVLDSNKIIKNNVHMLVTAMWSKDRLCLNYYNGTTLKTELLTDLTEPPSRLIKWARKNNLMPVTVYRTEEEFRQKVHSCLLSINHKIMEADAFKSFWNIAYDGNKIIERKPKKEVELQPLIHCFLSDQMLLSNIEIIPEYKSGEGNLDFLFIGSVEGIGLCKFCAEFKLAHSKDLNNGLWNQLPRYMAVSEATYGAYCVLNFKGDWFEEPKLNNGKSLDIHLNYIPKKEKKPVHKNIRSFIFNLAKSATASKKL
jgi:hypothetical protein